MAGGGSVGCLSEEENGFGAGGVRRRRMCSCTCASVVVTGASCSCVIPEYLNGIIY